MNERLKRFTEAEREHIEERVAIMIIDGYIATDRAYDIAIKDVIERNKSTDKLIKKWGM